MLRRILTATAAVFAISCGDPAGPSGSDPDSTVVATVSLASTSLTLGVGSTQTLTAVAANETGTVLSGKSFTWTSSDPTVATVGATTGVVTAVGTGSAIITAISEGKIGAAMVISAMPVNTITIDPPTAMVIVGAGFQLGAIPKDAAGAPLPNRTTTWSSSNNSVATVSSTGLVTGVSAGTATITATVEGKTATTAMTVSLDQITAASVSVGFSSACGLTVAGQAYCWGWPIWTTNAGAPMIGYGDLRAMGGGHVFKSISVGNRNACGITTAGAAYCTGLNMNGELGIGTNVTQELPVPVQVLGNRTWSAISVGWDHVLGLTTAGELYAWGNNTYGQLGDGTKTARNAPVLIAGRTYTAISAGSLQSMAIATSGAAYGWGRTPYTLGTRENDGTPQPTEEVIPRAVLGGLTFAKISANENYTVALTADGTPYHWGASACTGASPTTNGPKLLSGTIKFTSASAGWGHGLGITATGALYVFGDNFINSTPNCTPQPSVTTKTFTAVGAGGYNGVAIASTGEAYAYGSREGGMIDPLVQNNTFQPTPAPLSPPSYRLLGAQTKTIQAGTSGAIDLQVSAILGGFHAKGTFQKFQGSITLTVEGLPSGVTASISPSSVPAGTTLTQIIIAVSPTATAGVKNITIRGTSPGVPDKTLVIQLTITAPPPGATGSANLDCNVPSSVTAPYHCMTNSAGQKAPGRYDYPDIHGNWVDESAEICIDWKSTGKAAVKYKSGSWSAEKDWGVLVKSSGVPMGTTTQWYIFTEAADAQTALLSYDSSSKSILGWHFVKKACPF